MGLQPPNCWDCGFEFRQGRGCISLVSVAFRHVRSLCRADHSSRGVQPSVVGLSVFVKPGQWEGLDPLGVVLSWKEKYRNIGLKLNRYQRNPTKPFDEEKFCLVKGNFRFRSWSVTRLSWQAFSRSSLFLYTRQVTGNKAVPIHVMKACRGSGGVAPRSLNLDAR